MALRAWGPLTLICNSWELEGSKKFEWTKYLHGVLHGIKWMMFHNLLDIALGPQKKVCLMQSKGPWQLNYIVDASRITISSWWGPRTQAYVIVLRHGPLSLYTNLLAVHQLWKWTSISHNIVFGWLSKALRFFMVTTLNLCVKQPSVLLWYLQESTCLFKIRKH